MLRILLIWIQNTDGSSIVDLELFVPYPAFQKSQKPVLFLKIYFLHRKKSASVKFLAFLLLYGIYILVFQVNTILKNSHLLTPIHQVG